MRLVILQNYARFVTWSHSVFALPFALLGAFLAETARAAEASRAASPVSAWRFVAELAMVVLAMVAARSAAMAFNRIVDVRFDASNPRTAGRPLVTGQVAVRGAWFFFAASAACFFASSSAFLVFGNPWPIALAAPVLGVLCGYSLAKRFTAWCHIWLGVSLGMSPLAAWVAISPGTFGLLPVMLGAAVTCWVAGFDMIYALQDVTVDRRLGLRSIPVAVGPVRALRISRALHVAAIAGLLTVGLLAPPLGRLYYIAVALAAVLVWIQQSRVRPNDVSRVHSTFFLYNGVVSLLIGAAGIADMACRFAL
ncbi:MAG: putative 4-hydroxybenzoate polyprenyltransferase [Phycisphaerae bacterium]|nr:putative 4-hydroxybenzoate polyprenyltransferase [Phycisphaerae bacterium]